MENQGVLSPKKSVKYANSLDSRDIFMKIGGLIRLGCTRLGSAGNYAIEGVCRWRGMREDAMQFFAFIGTIVGTCNILWYIKNIYFNVLKELFAILLHGASIRFRKQAKNVLLVVCKNIYQISMYQYKDIQNTVEGCTIVQQRYKKCKGGVRKVLGAEQGYF